LSGASAASGRPHLVTGGSGYFGSLLVRRLRERGHAVRVFDLNDAEDRPPEVGFLRGDIRDAAAVEQAVRGCEVVHHNVAMVPLAKDRQAFWSVNEGGTRHLLEAARAARVRKVVSTSSSAVFGVPPKNPVDESVEPRPQEEYGRAKLAGEILCREYAARGLDVTIVRPRTIMGHGRLGVMQILFEWIRQGRNVPVLGRGDNLYQFVHADDLADACLRAAERPGPAVYNIGAADFCSMRETLEGLIAHAGTGSRVVSLPMRAAVALMKLTSALGVSPLGAYHSLMYGRSMYFDLAKPRAELCWEPRWGNVAMFCQSYDWYLAHRDEVLRASGASHHRSPVRQGVLAAVSRVLELC
jgi:nucleoside-diphosphate-sugar epimerase